MAATQGFLPTSTVAHPAGSRAPKVALTVLTLVASLAWLGTLAGAMSPGQTSPGTFAPYDWSRAGATGSSLYGSTYLVDQGPVATSVGAVGSVTITSPSAEAAKAAALAIRGTREQAVNRPGGSVYDSQVPAAARSTSAAWPGPHEAQGD
jgi:hypothetical protein